MQAQHSLTYQFSDLVALLRAHMTFVHDTGLFIPTDQSFQLGEVIRVTVTLPETPSPIEFTGEIVWITPKSTHDSSQIAGVGIQLNGENNEVIQNKIKSLLSQLPNEYVETYTM